MAEAAGLLVGLSVAFLNRFKFLDYYKDGGRSPFTLGDALGPSLRYRRTRVGRYLAALSYVWPATVLVDLEAVRRTHLNINLWTEEELREWKSSYVAGCSATAVAAAIFASVGLSALSLPNMDVTHWSARALLSASMAVGIFSVTYATYQQTVIGMMNTQEIRIWLSCGKADRGQKEARTDFWRFIARLQGGSVDYDPPYSLFPLESSMTAQMKIRLPSLLLQFAILLYLTGFGLYLLFAWVEDAIPPSLDYGAIFAGYVVVVGLVLLYLITLSIFNQIDQQKREQDFELDSTSIRKPVSQKQLDQWLGLIQNMRSLNLDDKESFPGLAIELQSLKEAWEEDRRTRDANRAGAKGGKSVLLGRSTNEGGGSPERAAGETSMRPPAMHEIGF